MNVEELLKVLRDAQMDDEAIKKLLSEAMASLKGPAENTPPATDEEAEKAEASKMFGVQL